MLDVKIHITYIIHNNVFAMLIVSSIQIQVLIEIPYCTSWQAFLPAFHQLGQIDLHGSNAP